jgi:AbrB family looped-hinge helix DNA binding protein
MKATLTSKGRITIPIEIRNRLRIQPGDVLEFDEEALFLKATKTIPHQAQARFGSVATNPRGDKDILQVMDELRGPVELPACKNR